MATQKGVQPVQDYLDKHKISALFEDLMSRLVHTLPSDPVPYLIKILQRFEEKAKKQELSKSPRVLSKVKSPAVPSEAKKSRPTLTRTTSSGTSEWTMLPNMPGMGEDRGYERPWVQNMKKIGKSPDSSVEDSPRVRKPQKSEIKTSPDREKIYKSKPIKSSAKLTASSELWACDGDETASRMPAASDQPRPTNQEQEETLMKEELSMKALEQVSQDEQMSKDVAIAQVIREQRLARPGNKAKQHKKALSELVAAQREVETLTFLDTGEEDASPDQEGFIEATDVLEDADELMDEGLSNIQSTGIKVKKSKKSEGAEVKVTMCNTCARVIKGDGCSEVRGGFGSFTSLESSGSSSDMRQGIMAASKGRLGPMSDDDFESASQVTGPVKM